MKKHKVFFNEYNILMDNSIYLPLSSGLLQSYAKVNPVIKKRFEFMPFIFKREQAKQILAYYNDPSVAAFSVSMWNMYLSLDVARKVKSKFPECLIIFGGSNVPFEAEDFFRDYSFVDVVVRGEGEQTFADLLISYLDSSDFSGIPGISFRDSKTSACVKSAQERPPEKNLDNFPSPYLEGVYDYLFSSKIDFQVIIETNRGCPFMCSYCFWGQGGLNKKYRFFSMERVKAIVKWCSEHKIKYVFCADSNFGMFERDLKIIRYLTESKTKYGFPEKLRVCYSKNTEDNIFKIGKLLTSHNMEKGITMSRQTNSPEAAFNVGRKNIRMSVYNSLQQKYNAENIPIYTELILGLPGETYHSFVRGIEEILQSGIRNQVFVYLCQVYPNTELSSKEYQDKFGISTVQIPLNEIHASVHSDESVVEYEELVVATKTMSVEDWKKMVVISWVMQLFHGLKVGFFILIYLVERYHIEYTDFFEYLISLKIRPKGIDILSEIISHFFRTAENILKGKVRGVVMSDFGSIYWEQEEAAFFKISHNKEEFYAQMLELVKEYLKSRGIAYNGEEVREVVKYQELRIPDYKPVKCKEFSFGYNLPEYFDTYFFKDCAGVLAKPQTMTLDGVKDYRKDKEVFAREVIVYGRKSNRILIPVKWSNLNIALKVAKLSS